MTIGDLLSQRAREQPGTPALIDAKSGRSLAFAELEREVVAATAWLRRRGLSRGDAVLVFVPMSLELYVALLAMFRLGVVGLFLDPSAGVEHMERCCARWAPKAFLAIRKAHLLRLKSGALRRIPLKISVGGWMWGAHRWPREVINDVGAAEPPGEAGVGEADPALVTFTSGSTGVPKGAVRTHGFLLAQYRALAPNIGLARGDVDLATLPVFTLANLAAGISTVIPDLDLRRPGAVCGANVFQQVERHGVTRITASPAFFERMLAHGRTAGRTLGSLRKLHTGGAPVFPGLLHGLRQLALAAQVVAVYGSTEAEPIAHLGADEISEEDLAAMRAGRGLLAGHPVPEIAVRVIEDRWGTALGRLSPEAFAGMEMGTGNAGEIVVSGAHVLPGYLGGVGDEETKFRVGDVVWHRTGDAGCFDDHGRLWLLGRCAARIDDAQGRLYPFTVECAAMAVMGVRRAAALSLNGRRTLAIETECTGAATTDIAGQVRAAVSWAYVEDVRVVDALPLDARHNAKIDYVALRKQFG